MEGVRETPDGRWEGCLAAAAPSDADLLEAIVTSEQAWREEAGEGPFTVAFVDLPAGRAGRLDGRYRDLGTGELKDASEYLVRSGTSHVWIMCSAPNAPEDRWSSIAETLELFESQGVQPSPG